MPNLDPIHDHAGSAADPDFTITEDDRIGALIEAHSELTASVLRTLGHLTTAVEGMSRLMGTMTHAMELESRASDHVARELGELRQAVESLAARLDPPASTASELADGAGLSPVDAPDERSCAQKMADGDFGEAVFAMYKIINDHLGGEWHTEVNASKATVRSVLALCTMYRSGKATTGGSDHNLRDNLRAILRAEGFDVRC